MPVSSKQLINAKTLLYGALIVTTETPSCSSICATKHSHKAHVIVAQLQDLQGS